MRMFASTHKKQTTTSKNSNNQTAERSPFLRIANWTSRLGVKEQLHTMQKHCCTDLYGLLHFCQHPSSRLGADWCVLTTCDHTRLSALGNDIPHSVCQRLTRWQCRQEFWAWVKLLFQWIFHFDISGCGRNNYRLSMYPQLYCLMPVFYLENLFLNLHKVFNWDDPNIFPNVLCWLVKVLLIL